MMTDRQSINTGDETKLRSTDPKKREDETAGAIGAVGEVGNYLELLYRDIGKCEDLLRKFGMIPYEDCDEGGQSYEEPTASFSDVWARLPREMNDAAARIRVIYRVVIVNVYGESYFENVFLEPSNEAKVMEIGDLMTSVQDSFRSFDAEIKMLDRCLEHLSEIREEAAACSGTPVVDHPDPLVFFAMPFSRVWEEIPNTLDRFSSCIDIYRKAIISMFEHNSPKG